MCGTDRDIISGEENLRSMKNRDYSLHFKSRDEIISFQENGLRETIEYLAARSVYYRRMFQKHKIEPGKIRKIEDLCRIPVTTKEDLQTYNEAFICVPRKNIIDYVTTSGTSGEPVTFALTENDLERLSYNEACSFSLAGCTGNDIIQLMTTIDRRFMAGLAYFLGARRLGSGVIRVGNGIPELQWDTIRRTNPTVCIVVPSFLIKLVEFAKNNGINHNGSTLKKAICIGEALRNTDGSLTTLGQKISTVWPSLELFSTYASTEMQTSFTECSAHCGGHIPADLIIVEILDENNEPVNDGEPGEVTITTLGVECMPLLRFRTGDICIKNSEPCRCGRQSARLGPVIGRKNQMIKFKGTTLYPPALFDILNNIPDIRNYIVEVHTNSLGTDQIRIIIDSPGKSEESVKHIKDIFRSRIRVAPDIVFDSPESIASRQMPSTSRKTLRFFDLRK